MIDVPDNNAVYYYHFDGLGSVAALSDSGGNIVERYEYDIFGQPTIKDAEDNVISQSDVGNPYLFTGRRYDTETSLYYYRARYYEPYIGRFLQTDPIGYVDGMNVYTYVGNQPITRTDPLGLKTTCFERCDAWYRLRVAACGAHFALDCWSAETPIGGVINWIICMHKARMKHIDCFTDCAALPTRSHRYTKN